jgi:hypothetical protein
MFTNHRHAHERNGDAEASRGDSDEVLAPVARASYKTNLFLVGIIGGTLTFIGAFVAIDRKLAQSAAVEAITPQLSTLSQKIEAIDKREAAHEARVDIERPMMDAYVREERAARRSINAKLDALCRASPKANCPLGDGEKAVDYTQGN